MLFFPFFSGKNLQCGAVMINKTSMLQINNLEHMNEKYK